MTQHRSEGKDTKEKDARLDLSVGEVMAATGATVLGTLLVKVLDLWGTVLGTAVLSLFTSVGAVLILRTMRQTSDRVKLQLATLSAAASKGDRRAEAALNEAEAVDLPSPEEAIEEAETAERRHSPRRTLIAILISSVIVFALTIGVLTLLGGIATGDPTRLIIEERAPIINEDGEDGDEPGDTEPTGPDEPETDPGEDSPSEPGTSAEEDDATPREDPTEDEPTLETPSEQDEGMDDTGEPTSPEAAATDAESPTGE